MQMQGFVSLIQFFFSLILSYKCFEVKGEPRNLVTQKSLNRNQYLQGNNEFLFIGPQGFSFWLYRIFRESVSVSHIAELIVRTVMRFFCAIASLDPKAECNWANYWTCKNQAIDHQTAIKFELPIFHFYFIFPGRAGRYGWTNFTAITSHFSSEKISRVTLSMNQTMEMERSKILD